jgi:hypothetical protein
MARIGAGRYMGIEVDVERRLDLITAHAGRRAADRRGHHHGVVMLDHHDVVHVLIDVDHEPQLQPLRFALAMPHAASRRQSPQGVVEPWRQALPVVVVGHARHVCTPSSRRGRVRVNRHRNVARARRVARVPSHFAVLAVCAVLAAGCAGAGTVARPVATTAGSQSAPTGSALAAVARLAVKGRAPKTGYTREQFGDGWESVDGCDMRDRILIRDLRAKTFRVATNRCVVLSGRLADPYTSTTIDYVRGAGAGVDIDHVVALGDAWQKGARGWPASERVAFANDPLNLLAVDASANRQKGDGDTATWLPANKAFRCTYVARQVSVKLKYAVSITKAERDAMLRVLGACPSKRVSVAGKAPAAPSGQRVFANCAAARAAGVAPIRRGSPLYPANRRLDRNKDGVACQ